MFLCSYIQYRVMIGRHTLVPLNRDGTSIVMNPRWGFVMRRIAQL